MKYLHIWPNEKFTSPFIEFINENFNKEEHLFLILGEGIGANICQENNVIELPYNLKSLIFVVKKMYHFKKIYLHSLFTLRIVEILFLQPWLLKKCTWIIWGGDLYEYRKPKITIKSRLYEFMRSIVIRNLGELITHIKGDYELAKEWYKAKGQYYYSFGYLSNVYRDFQIESEMKINKTLNIQLGNSADPTNNHIEILHKLSQLGNQNFKIICPLSYGDFDYAKEVINVGQNLFGDRFQSLMTFLPLEEYQVLLKQIDVAIFNHNRQQAVGNITSLISMGKKVYIRDDITTWDFCREHNLKVFSTNKELTTLFDLYSDEIAEKNIQNCRILFSERKLIEDWKRIFNSKF